ncbi:tyramine receptor Ser-2-like [Watersipora subatra]|uniref:tyramine receptor Ser-2-like n=1 Tax=Watersipora subatra TaxID=2589382 RepID=UPI00355BF38A
MEVLNSSAEDTSVWHETANLTDYELRIALYNNIIYYSIMVPLALAGNIFTLTAVIMVLKIKRNIPNLLIGVLACTDLFSIVTCHLISMASMAKKEYIGSEAVCYFQSMMAYTYFKMGFLTKCCISLDRFIALALPLRYRKLVTMKRVTLLIINNVLFSFGTSALTLLVDRQYIYQLPTWYMCANDFEHFSTYKLIIVAVEGAIFTLGVILFFISNITVIRVVLNLSKRRKITLGRVISLDHSKRQKDKVETNCCILRFTIKSFFRQPKSLDENSNKILADEQVSQMPMPKRSSSSEASIKEKATSLETTETAATKAKETKETKTKEAKELKDTSKKNTKQKKQRKELQLAKLVTIIVSVFVLLWLPYMAVIYWEHHNSRSVHPFLEDIVMKLVFANCCINPLLYGVFNANFRKAYLYYTRMLAFYVTCKMTKKPQDIRRSEAKYDIQVNNGLVPASNILDIQETIQPTVMSDVEHCDPQQTSEESQIRVNSLNEILRELPRDKSDAISYGGEDLDLMVLTQAIHNLYKMPEDSSDIQHRSSPLTVVST